MDTWTAPGNVPLLLTGGFLLGALAERLRQSAILGYLNVEEQREMNCATNQEFKNLGRARESMRRARRAALSVVLLLAFLSSAAPEGTAQESGGTIDDHGVWLMFVGEGRLGEENPEHRRRFRWWFDGQARFVEDSDGYDQALLRPGLGYDLTDETSVWLGYAWVHTDPAGSASFEEHRFWQQFLWSTRFEPVEFSSRTRLEQRFVETGSDTGWRFRQFFKGTYAFAPESPLGLAAYEELFLDLNDTSWGANSGFAQNRLFAGFRWELDSKGRVTAEIGYLNQYLRNEGSSDRMNHILSLNLFVNFD